MNCEITTRRTINASPETAFNAFADGAIWSRWFSAKSEVDLRVGGRFSNEDGDTGKYIEIVPERLLRFSWDGSFQGSCIELQFSPRAADACEVSLRHYQLATQADADKMRSCWRWTLDNLASFLETGKPMSMSEWKTLQSQQ